MRVSARLGCCSVTEAAINLTRVMCVQKKRAFHDNDRVIEELFGGIKHCGGGIPQEGKQRDLHCHIDIFSLLDQPPFERKSERFPK